MDLKRMRKLAGLTESSALTPAQITFGKKLAKKVKATTDFETAISLFERLPGWKVERSTGALVLKGVNLDLVGRKKRGFLPMVAKEGSSAHEIDFRTNDSDLKGVSVFLANASSGAPDREFNVEPLRAAVQVTPTVPAHPKEGTVYVSKFEVVNVKPYNDATYMHLWLGTMWLGAKAATLITPSKQTFIVYDEPSAPGDFASSSFYTWAGKTSLADDVTALLGDAAKPKTADDEDRERIGTLETTGFCTICNRRQKMHNLKSKRPLMYDHGYSIPSQALRSGWAPRQGSCYGVGFPPYEVSVAGIDAYLDVLKKAQDTMKAELAELNANPQTITRLERDGYGYKETRKQIDYTPEHPKWMEVLALEKGRVIKELNSLEDNVQYYTQRRAAWKRVPTYDEKTAGDLFYK